MSESADIVVIGGGVMGASIAFHLARRRAGKILLLEKSFLGAASSGKSGAIIRQYYSHELLASMAGHGLRMYREFPQVVGGPSVFTRAGMVVVSDAAGRAQMEANVAMLAGLGVEAKMLSPEDLRAIDSRVAVGATETAAYETEAGYCEALQVVASFAAAAREMEVRVREDEQVTQLVVENQRVAGVATTRRSISTRTVVLAAGGWSAGLAKSAGVELPVRACRTQVALLRRPCEFGPSHPVYGDLANQIYFRPTHGEMTHVGNVDPREENAAVDPDRYNEVADREFAAEMRSKIERRYPGLRRGIGRGGYAALYSVTPDWQPIIDRMPGVAGAFCAVGFSGHGFKMAPAVGQLLSELVLDGRATSFDIHPLRASRFAEGEPFGGKTFAKVMG
jgi:glycine/D-amino acid oxidase-like deaminating enzyme